MRAVVLHGPGDYRYEPTWPDPELRPGWARIRVRYTGVCGSDLPRFGKAGSYHYPPIIVGHEFCGDLETPAAGSRRFRVGERVAVLPIIPCGQCEGCRIGPFHCRQYQFLGSRNDGGLAEYCAVPEENLFRLPAGLNLRLGALVEPLAVALHAVRRSGFRSGANAMVFGAGTIGLLIALWLKTLGASRFAVADVRRESLEVARRCGLSEVFDFEAMVPANVEPFDVVFEAAGARPALLQAIRMARPKGTVAVIGRDTQDTLLPLEHMERLMRKELTLEGCWGYDLRSDKGLLRRMLTENSLALGALITQEVPLESAPGLIAQMLARSLYYCKALVRI